jgi:hypothetical protein
MTRVAVQRFGASADPRRDRKTLPYELTSLRLLCGGCRDSGRNRCRCLRNMLGVNLDAVTERLLGHHDHVSRRTAASAIWCISRTPTTLGSTGGRPLKKYVLATSAQ